MDGLIMPSTPEVSRAVPKHSIPGIFTDYSTTEYLLPNDERERERLDLQHIGFKMMLNGRLHLAPLVRPQRILDIATGTGIWAIEFGMYRL